LHGLVVKDFDSENEVHIVVFNLKEISLLADLDLLANGVGEVGLSVVLMEVDGGVGGAIVEADHRDGSAETNAQEESN